MIVEAWKGQRPLWKVFWLYYFAGAVVVLGVVGGILGLASLMPSIIGLWMKLFAVAFLVAWKVWALVSIWRCAGNSSGSSYKYLARGYAVLFLLILPLTVYDNMEKFREFRLRGYEAVVRAQLRNAAVAEEAFFARSNRYTDRVEELYNQEFQADPQVRLIAVVAKNKNGAPKFLIIGRHTAAENPLFFDSSTGVISQTTLKEIRDAGVKGID
jgi:hypothetical protein